MLNVYHQDETLTIICGDVREVLPQLMRESVQTVVTSPPYYGLRDYGVSGQIGLEKTPQAYVAELEHVFELVRLVLRKDGTLWLNLGDSYKNKDLIGIPWRMAFSLQSSGWYLRQDIIWSKRSCLPESVKDRCTKSHEYLFLLSRERKYFFDCAALRGKTVTRDSAVRDRDRTRLNNTPGRSRMHGLKTNNYEFRNKRSVWTIAQEPCREAHFATFPQALIEPCILAGSRPGDTVLDPFGGAGTTGLVANKHARKAVLIELNEKYCEIALKRNRQAFLPISQKGAH